MRQGRDNSAVPGFRPGLGCAIFNCQRTNTRIRLGIPRCAIPLSFHSRRPFGRRNGAFRQFGGEMVSCSERGCSSEREKTPLFVCSKLRRHGTLPGATWQRRANGTDIFRSYGHNSTEFDRRQERLLFFW
jgi:hypothetical protein